MVKYRALLIGNSTYPADEHNLQQLRGPIKDIAAVNRALIDKDTGLFADADVTLLPEATSTRAIRALGKFFAGADRDDVLLMYFSGHGKLDQNGRLHLCMQDTETTDLLATAVSTSGSTSSPMRRGRATSSSSSTAATPAPSAAVTWASRSPDRAGTSCRAAGDAVGQRRHRRQRHQLLHPASRRRLLTAGDSDDDGYVSFSDVYAYIDRRLREGASRSRRGASTGTGICGWRSARTAVVPPATAPTADAEAAPGRADGPTPYRRCRKQPSTPPAQARRRCRTRQGRLRRSTSSPTRATSTGGPAGWWTRGRVLAAVLVVVVAGAAGAAALLLRGWQRDGSTAGSGTYTATGPWRFRIDGTAYGEGCTVALRTRRRKSPSRCRATSTRSPGIR